MFDPHRVGPSSSSYYDRNKGRVLQRKLVDPVSEPLTRLKLLSYLPIMRLNGLVQTPIVQHFHSNDPTFSFDSDTYLATGSTVTFSGSSSKINISQIQIIPESSTPPTSISLSQFQYTSTTDTIEFPGEESNTGYAVLIYISFVFSSSSYTFHTDSKKEEGVSTNPTFEVPANSLYVLLRNQIFPLSFQLYTTTGSGIMAYYSPTYTYDAYGVLNPQYFHFDDDRLATN